MIRNRRYNRLETKLVIGNLVLRDYFDDEYFAEYSHINLDRCILDIAFIFLGGQTATVSTQYRAGRSVISLHARENINRRPATYDFSLDPSVHTTVRARFSRNLKKRNYPAVEKSFRRFEPQWKTVICFQMSRFPRSFNFRCIYGRPSSLC